MADDDATGLSELDAYGFLSAVENERTSAFTASANPVAHTGAMIALVPSKADLARLAHEGGEPAEELHLTLAFLGEANLISEEMRSQIIDAAGQYFTDAFDTEAFSVNIFNPHNPDMETALVLGIKGEDLVNPRSNALSAVRGFFEMPAQHEPWIPHVTLAYTDDVRKAPSFVEKLGPVKFDTLRFAFGGEITDIPLHDGDPVEVLAAAFVEREHPRDAGGQFTESPGGGFASKIKDALQGDDAYKSVKYEIRDDTRDKKGFSADRRAAVTLYTTAAVREINGALREAKGGETHTVAPPPPPKWAAPGENPNDRRSFQNDEDLRKTIDFIDQTMDSSVSDRDIVVHRGVGDLRSMFGDAWSADDMTGVSYTDHGFSSTSSDVGVMRHLSEGFRKANPESWGRAAEMRILVPKGTKMMAPAPRIKEITLDRGLSYRIVADHGVDARGFRQLDVEVVK